MDERFAAYRDSLTRLRAAGVTDAQISAGLHCLQKGDPPPDGIQDLDALMRLTWLCTLGPAARAPGMFVATSLAVAMGEAGMDSLEELMALAESPERLTPAQERHLERIGAASGPALGAAIAAAGGKGMGHAFYNRGVKRAGDGDHAGAVADFSVALTLDPADAQALINRAIMRHALGDGPAALADLELAEAARPDGASAYARRAAIALELAQPEVALADGFAACELVAADDPMREGAEGVLMAAVAAVQQGAMDEGRAVEELRRIALGFTRQGRPENVVSMADGLAQFFPARTWLAQLVIAIAANEAGAYEDLRPIAADLCAARPDLAEAWFHKGMAELGLECFPEALAAFDRALEADKVPSSGLARWTVRYQRALALHGAGEADRALAEMVAVADERPNDLMAWIFRGAWSALRGDPEAALAAYTHAVETLPETMVPWYARASQLVSMQRYDEALADLTRACKLSPGVAAEAAKDPALAPLLERDGFKALLRGAAAAG